MKITINTYVAPLTGKEFKCLVIDNVMVAQQAVKDIIGRSLCEFNFEAHAIREEINILGDMRKVGMDVYLDLCSKINSQKKIIIMQKTGGYCNLEQVDWKQTKIETVEFDYKKSLRDYLTV